MRYFDSPFCYFIVELYRFIHFYLLILWVYSGLQKFLVQWCPSVNESESKLFNGFWWGRYWEVGQCFPVWGSFPDCKTLTFPSLIPLYFTTQSSKALGYQNTFQIISARVNSFLLGSCFKCIFDSLFSLIYSLASSFSYPD